MLLNKNNSIPIRETCFRVAGMGSGLTTVSQSMCMGGKLEFWDGQHSYTLFLIN